MKYRLHDEFGSAEIVEAESITQARRLAREWVGGWSWDGARKTCWVKVYIDVAADVAEELETIKVEVHPSEPRCREASHLWRRDGGSDSDPGVFAHGGGIRLVERCAHCGLKRVEDTWAQDPSDGEQGLFSIEYDAADQDI